VNPGFRAGIRPGFALPIGGNLEHTSLPGGAGETPAGRGSLPARPARHERTVTVLRERRQELEASPLPAFVASLQAVERPEVHATGSACDSDRFRSAPRREETRTTVHLTGPRPAEAALADCDARSQTSSRRCLSCRRSSGRGSRERFILARRSFAVFLCLAGIIFASPYVGSAETRTVCWDPVTEYADSTPDRIVDCRDLYGLLEPGSGTCRSFAATDRVFRLDNMPVIRPGHAGNGPGSGWPI